MDMIGVITLIGTKLKIEPLLLRVLHLMKLKLEWFILIVLPVNFIIHN